MSQRTVKNALPTIALMTGIEGIVNPLNMEGDTVLVIPSSEEQAQWCNMRYEQRNSLGLISVRSVMTERGYTVTTTITQNPLKYVGSAPLVITSGTESTEGG